MNNKAFTGAQQRINEKYMLIDIKVKSIEHSVTKILQFKKSKAKELILKLDSLSPLKTLARGYGIISKNGTIVKSVTQLSKDDEISIKMKDGETKAKVII